MVDFAKHLEPRSRAEYGAAQDAYLARLEARYRVLCKHCGYQGLSEEEYRRQLARPDLVWRCPRCQQNAMWDDEYFERWLVDDRSAAEIMHESDASQIFTAAVMREQVDPCH